MGELTRTLTIQLGQQAFTMLMKVALEQDVSVSEVVGWCVQKSLSVRKAGQKSKQKKQTKKGKMSRGVRRAGS